MDVNSALLQIPSSASASSSEGASSRSQAGRNPGIGGTKKSFASVLHTVHQGERKERPQESDDAESRRVFKSEPKPDQRKSVRGDTPSSGEINGRGLDAETDQLSQNQTDRSDDKKDHSQDGGAIETKVSGELAPALGQVAPSQSEPVTPSALPTDDPGQGGIEDALPSSSQDNGIADVSTAPVLVTAEPEESVTATTEQTDQSLVLPQGATVPGTKQDQAASATQPRQETNDAPSGRLLDPKAEPVTKAVDQKTGEQRGTPTQGHDLEDQAASIQPTAEGAKQASLVSQELSRLNAAGPQLTRLVEQPAPQKQDDAPAHPYRAPYSPPPSSDTGGEERAGKSVAIAPHGLQAGADSGQSSDVLWSNQGERQSSHHENPWTSHAPMVPPQSDLPDDPAAQVMTAASAASSQSRPVDSRPASPAGSASSVSPAHDLEPFIPMMNRSVVFEIAEPDLGRINIRVAMTNELVHAYLSSDRSEVGQFLINGQERLQSALQSNGLEMGQFRVDIDRQSAGRSFQQGPPQDQSRMWRQDANGTPREAGVFERHEAAGLLYAGRLNVVA
jgi:hypothetical protein